MGSSHWQRSFHSCRLEKSSLRVKCLCWRSASVPASTETKGFVCDDTGKDKPCADDAATDCFVDLMPKLTEKNWASCKAECEKVTTGPWCCHEFEGKMCTLFKGGTKTKMAPPPVKDKMT